MKNNVDFVRLWSKRINSPSNSEAHSDLRLRRINSQGGGENVGRKRKATSMKKRKVTRVKRPCMSKYSHKYQQKLSEKKRQRDLIIRGHLQELQEITPNCPKSDIGAILDSVIEYTTRLQLAVFLIYYARKM